MTFRDMISESDITDKNVSDITSLIKAMYPGRWDISKSDNKVIWLSRTSGIYPTDADIEGIKEQSPVDLKYFKNDTGEGFYISL